MGWGEGEELAYVFSSKMSPFLPINKAGMRTGLIGSGNQPLHSQQTRGEKDLEVKMLAHVLAWEDKRVFLKG